MEYSLLTNSVDGAPLVAQGAGRVSFACGVLWNNADPVEGDVDTVAVVLSNPRYCQPLALNYGYASTSPVVTLQELVSPETLENMCPGVVGVTGPPCGQTLTDAPIDVTPRLSRLLQPVPNPFNATTTLRYELARSGRAELRIYDVRGRLVVELTSPDVLEAGAHEVVWRGQNSRGLPVASGIYLARLRLDGELAGPARRLVLLK
jgi:hypothetical protein